MPGRVLVGTSGFSYAHWAKGVFYPPGLPHDEWLTFYASRFPCVELNVTFYRLPPKETFEGWARETPSDFRFAVKGSRYVTHVKRLRDPAEPVRTLRDQAAPLGRKLEVVLWQLPPRMNADAERLEVFCRTLRDEWPLTRHAFEFRDGTWFDEGVYRVLEHYGHALCVAHSTRWPREERLTAPFTYVRMHGGASVYGSEYSGTELEDWSAKVRRWRDAEADAYVFFNNDVGGHAVRDAARFARLAGAALPAAATAR